MKVSVLVSFHNHEALVRRVAESARPAEYERYAAELRRKLSEQELFVRLLIGDKTERGKAIRETLRRIGHEPAMRRMIVFALPKPFASVIVWLRGTIGNLRWRSRVRRLERLLNFS